MGLIKKKKQREKLFAKDFINNYDTPIEEAHLFFANHEGTPEASFENYYDEEQMPAKFENEYK